MLSLPILHVHVGVTDFSIRFGLVVYQWNRLPFWQLASWPNLLFRFSSEGNYQVLHPNRMCSVRPSELEPHNPQAFGAEQATGTTKKAVCEWSLREV